MSVEPYDRTVPVERFPVPDPFDEGMLDVGDGHLVYWNVRGAPRGKPVVLLHGGPGSGSSPRTPGMFDPAKYRIVQFDQRNCGRSTPGAATDVVNFRHNTTAHLVADMERVRELLDIERWMVWGGSWGTTLALAYAQTHPDRVTEMILVAVVATSRADVEWITRSMGRVFPAEWQRFVEGVPEAERDGNLAAAYSRLLHSLDPTVCERAALAWCKWEDTHIATFPGATPSARYEDPAFRLSFARLVTHYWSNAGFLQEGQLLRDVDRISHVPALLVHGRFDISGPPDFPWKLAQRWPAAQLVLVDEGHPGGDESVRLVMDAAARFAATP
jgi:proline iminopeptidase